MTMHRITKILTKGPTSRVLSHITRTTRGYASSVEDGSGKGTARAFATQAAAEPFLSGSSSTYVEEMYLAWQRDPDSVHKVIKKHQWLEMVVMTVCHMSCCTSLCRWWIVPILQYMCVMCNRRLYKQPHDNNINNNSGHFYDCSPVHFPSECTDRNYCP